MRSSELPPPTDEYAKWEAQFNQLNNASRDDDFETELQEAYQSNFPEQRLDEDGIPQLESYTFGVCC